MALRIGSSTPSKLYLGANEVSKAYLGASQAYSSAPAGLWTPSNISSGLGLWLDADDPATMTISSGVVTAWDDKSPNNYQMIGASEGTSPSYLANQLNGKPTLRTSGNDRLFSTTTSLFRNVSGASWIVVGKHPPETPGPNAMLVFCSRGDNASSTRFGLTSNPQPGGLFMSLAGRRLDSDGFTYITSTTDRIVDAYFIEVGNADYANAQANHWTNGTQDRAEAPFLTAGNSSDTSPLSVDIFGPSTNISNTNTELAEVIAIEGVLTNDLRQRLEGYLAHKWGLAGNLPVGHPYKSSAPTV